MHLETDGIVIREMGLGDNTKLLTFLTFDYGKITAAAKGAKSFKSKLASGAQLFAYSRINLFKLKDKYTLDSADVKDIFYELRNDIKKISLAQYFAELVNYAAVENDECRELLRLLLNSLFVLCKKDIDISLIKSVFEFKAMAACGFMPDLECCHSCNKSENLFFCLKEGCLLCANCKIKTVEECLPLNLSVLKALRYLLKCDISKMFSFTMSDEGLKKLNIISEKYMMAHIEHKFASLDFYNNLG